MISKLAVKRLTASDLTFFDWHFSNAPAGNQKAINLNADVFRDELYPSLDVIIRDRQNKLGIDLWIHGPAAAEPVNLQRKIIKGASYKNWRLDGEIVHNPEDQPDRYNVLVPGDIALLGFEGDLFPDTVSLLLLAGKSQEDQLLVGALDRLLDTKRMTTLDPEALKALSERLKVPDAHPVWALASDHDFVDAAAGVAPAMDRLLTRPRPRRMTTQDLRKARQAAEEIGLAGEQLVDHYLQDSLDTGAVSDYVWASDINAIAPHDFRVCRPQGWEKLEVKSTQGHFSRAFHLPRSEVQDMASGGESYLIARVYGLSSEGAKMRISCDLQDLGRTILEASSTLPAGVELDGVTVTPDETLFGPEIVLRLPHPNHK